jgi:hypothetical protein
MNKLACYPIGREGLHVAADVATEPGVLLRTSYVQGAAAAAVAAASKGLVVRDGVVVVLYFEGEGHVRLLEKNNMAFRDALERLAKEWADSHHEKVTFVLDKHTAADARALPLLMAHVKEIRELQHVDELFEDEDTRHALFCTREEQEQARELLAVGQGGETGKEGGGKRPRRGRWVLAPQSAPALRPMPPLRRPRLAPPPPASSSTIPSLTPVSSNPHSSPSLSSSSSTTIAGTTIARMGSSNRRATSRSSSLSSITSMNAAYAPTNNNKAPTGRAAQPRNAKTHRRHTDRQRPPTEVPRELTHPDLEHTLRVEASIVDLLRPTNEKALALAKRSAEDQVQTRLRLGETLGKKHCHRRRTTVLCYDKEVRLWKSGKGKGGEGVGDHERYKKQENYFYRMLANHGAPEIIVYHSAKYPHDDPRSTLAVDGIKFKQYRNYDSSKEEVFFTAPDLMSTAAYGTPSEVGADKYVFVYRCLLEDTPNMTISACTGITFKMRPGAACNILPIGVLQFTLRRSWMRPSSSITSII